MSDLPTLWVYGPSLAQAMATPADRVARVSAFLRRDHDESREHEFVPAARLDDATLEIARLKAQVSNAVANLEEAQILFASIRQADALAPWACESEPGEDSFDEQVREMLRDLEKITGFAARQRAALTPKEP